MSRIIEAPEAIANPENIGLRNTIVAQLVNNRLNDIIETRAQSSTRYDRSCDLNQPTMQQTQSRSIIPSHNNLHLTGTIESAEVERGHELGFNASRETHISWIMEYSLSRSRSNRQRRELNARLILKRHVRNSMITFAICSQKCPTVLRNMCIIAKTTANKSL